MRKTLPLSLALIALIAAPTSAQGPLRQMLMKRMMERAAQKQKDNPPPPAPAEQAIAYGKDPAQTLDFAASTTAKSPAPLILFVHGGGWSRGSKDNAVGGWKAPHYTQTGYHFASMDYRLVPNVGIEDQAADIASALATLIAQADKLGIDRRKIVLMGHSAGAHLVALVGTDERYLKKAGLSFADVAGIIPIDGAAYDVPKQMEQAGRFMATRYDQAFGKDPARQRAVSPVFQAAAPNAARFLLIHVQREDGVAQNKELEAALSKSGTQVERREFEGKGLMGHAEINRSLGDPKYAATPAVDAWLKTLFSR